ncbi:hypothetical protein [Cellulomonas sp. P5_C5]
MTTDLHTLLGRARDDLGAPHVADDLGLARVVRSVRRRRTQRHAVESVVGIAAAGAVGVAGWAGLSRVNPPTPADTPSPSVSASPTPTPTSTPSTTPAPPVEPTPRGSAGLPELQELPVGLLAQTTPGWVLAVYESRPSGADVAVANSVVLVSPAGERYRVVDLPLDRSVTLAAWTAGDPTALVSVASSPGGERLSARTFLDLTTGTLTPDEQGLPVDATYQGLSPDAVEVWTSPGDPLGTLWEVGPVGAEPLGAVSGDPGTFLIGPGGFAVTENEPGFIGVVDLRGGRLHQYDYGVPGASCEPVGWVDERIVLATCWDAGGDPQSADSHPSLWGIEFSETNRIGLKVGDLVAGDPWPQPWSGRFVRPGVVAFAAGTIDLHGCVDGVSTWEAGVFTQVEGRGDRGENVFSVRVGEAQDVYVESSPGCSGDAAPRQLTVHPSDGGSTLLAPVPADDGTSWAAGLSSWVEGAEVIGG